MDHFVDRFVRDRRISTRHLIRTPIRFRIRKSAIPEQRAETDNVSERGVFFATKFPMRVGTVVDLLLKMPEVITGKKATEWRCTGHVVRVVPQVSPGERLGVGVEFDFYEICLA
jgi:hypothetical protein